MSRRIRALVQTSCSLPRRAAAPTCEDRLHFGHDRERHLLGRLGAQVQASPSSLTSICAPMRRYVEPRALTTLASAETQPFRVAPSYARRILSRSLIAKPPDREDGARSQLIATQKNSSIARQGPKGGPAKSERIA
jgi:hypothetical protein